MHRLDMYYMIMSYYHNIETPLSSLEVRYEGNVDEIKKYKTLTVIKRGLKNGRLINEIEKIDKEYINYDSEYSGKIIIVYNYDIDVIKNSEVLTNLKPKISNLNEEKMKQIINHREKMK